MPTIKTLVSNYSRYPIDTVWENAQDLEHVSILHQKTNKYFELIWVQKDSNSSRTYDGLVYRAKRRLPLGGSVQTFGVRKIISDYNLWQMEFIPLLGIKSALNSVLYQTGKEEFPTLLLDEVVIEVPAFLMPFKKWLISSLHSHARIQCQEDESFRMRRVELEKRSIRLPFSIYNLSCFDELGKVFTANLKNIPGTDF